MSEDTEVKVLIVEDEQSISNLCERLLSEDGYTVFITDNGEDAERLVASHNFRLCIVDLRLPKESGIDFYMWLLQEYSGLSKKVVFMTGSVMGGESLTFLERCGRPYLLKPFRVDELKRVVATIEV